MVKLVIPKKKNAVLLWGREEICSDHSAICGLKHNKVLLMSKALPTKDNNRTTVASASRNVPRSTNVILLPLLLPIPQCVAQIMCQPIK